MLMWRNPKIDTHSGVNFLAYSLAYALATGAGTRFDQVTPQHSKNFPQTTTKSSIGTACTSQCAPVIIVWEWGKQDAQAAPKLDNRARRWKSQT